MRQRPTWLLRALLVLVSSTVAVISIELVLEAVTRPETVMGSQVPRYRQSTRSIRLMEFPPGLEDSKVPYDEYLATTDKLVKREYPVKIDEDGFIQPSRIHSDPDLKIVFLGGSTTECLFVLEQKRFPYLVGRLLEKQFGVNCNTWNGGRSGAHSMHSNHSLLAKVVPLQPDFAVLMHNLNDHLILLYTGTYWNDHWRRGVLIQHPTENTSRPAMAPLVGIKTFFRATLPELYARLKRVQTLALTQPSSGRDEWADLRGRKVVYQLEQMLIDFKRSLTTFCEVSKVHDIRPVLMTQANRLTDEPSAPLMLDFKARLGGMGIPFHEWKEIYDSFNQAIRDVARDQRVLLVDLAELVPQSSEYMFDFVHFNDEGSEFVANVIARELAPRITDLRIRPDTEAD